MTKMVTRIAMGSLRYVTEWLTTRNLCEINVT